MRSVPRPPEDTTGIRRRFASECAHHVMRHCPQLLTISAPSAWMLSWLHRSPLNSVVKRSGRPWRRRPRHPETCPSLSGCGQRRSCVQPAELCEGLIETPPRWTPARNTSNCSLRRHRASPTSHLTPSSQPNNSLRRCVATFATAAPWIPPPRSLTALLPPRSLIWMGTSWTRRHQLRDDGRRSRGSLVSRPTCWLLGTGSPHVR